MKPPYQYAAEAVRVVDGDTIDVILDFGFSLKQKMRLRLSGIDTPELNSKDEEERAKAQLAKAFVKKAVFIDGAAESEDGLYHSRELIVKTIKTRSGKERQTFGRYVAEVYIKDDNGFWYQLNEMLVHKKLATG
jgi:micrococcal nuclease